MNEIDECDEDSGRECCLSFQGGGNSNQYEIAIFSARIVTWTTLSAILNQQNGPPYSLLILHSTSLLLYGIVSDGSSDGDAPIPLCPWSIGSRKHRSFLQYSTTDAMNSFRFKTTTIPYDSQSFLNINQCISWKYQVVLTLLLTLALFSVAELIVDIKWAAFFDGEDAFWFVLLLIVEEHRNNWCGGFV